MILDEFINNIKEQELSLYRDLIDKVTDAYKNASEDVLKNKPWEFWDYVDNNICADYDVQDTFRKEYLGQYGRPHIETDVRDHLIKLQKSITKVTGDVKNIDKVDETEYVIEGTKADCSIKVTPVKLSSTKNVMKTRIKVIDIQEHPEELVEIDSEYEESEYVKEWKAQELEGYRVALENWKKELEKLSKNIVDKKEYKSELIQKYIDTNGKQPEVSNGRYTDPEISKASKDLGDANDKYISYKYSNRFFADYGFSKDFEERCKKEIDRHFKELQNKVEKKIGKIIKIQDLGGDDYAFEGENGKCVINVVWAGGYNIQRLHTRWIVKNWNLED